MLFIKHICLGRKQTFPTRDAQLAYISGWKAQLYSPLDEMVYDFKTLYAVLSDVLAAA
jgi:hypothetical protein